MDELLEACKAGDIDKVKTLIENGFRVNYVNKHGESPLLLASSRGYTEIVKLLKSIR